MFGPFGFSEIVFLFFIALVIFGPKRLPELGKTLGKGLREFKKASDDLKANWEEQVRTSEMPVADLKQTFEEVRTEVESSTGIDPELKQTLEEVQVEVESAATIEDTPSTPATPEEAKPDGHTS